MMSPVSKSEFVRVLRAELELEEEKQTERHFGDRNQQGIVTSWKWS